MRCERAYSNTLTPTNQPTNQPTEGYNHERYT
nr:MAG TPA: hypothetical protein [Bacteriophage sp.]